jgi:predicted dehydrogenase
VVGAGSIGARHAVNLAALGAAVTVTDADHERAQATATSASAKSTRRGLDEAAKYDGVVIASPTAFHALQASLAASVCAHVLVEKPLGMNLAEVQPLAGLSDRIMVGYNLRFHQPLQHLVEAVSRGDIGKPFSAHLWFGSWLPDWRPTVDYRQTYSARRELGGGVLLDAIHELDLLLWLFDSRLEVVGAFVGRIGPLEIDTEDAVQALLRHADGALISLDLDYLSRRYRRGVEVRGEAATIRYDWARSVLERESQEAHQSEDVTVPIAVAYEHEARCFLNWILGTDQPPVDGSSGRASVALAEAIRTAAS